LLRQILSFPPTRYEKRQPAEADVRRIKADSQNPTIRGSFQPIMAA
jgi:hypothetical protein